MRNQASPEQRMGACDAIAQVVNHMRQVEISDYDAFYASMYAEPHALPAFFSIVEAYGKSKTWKQGNDVVTEATLRDSVLNGTAILHAHASVIEVDNPGASATRFVDIHVRSKLPSRRPWRHSLSLGGSENTACDLPRIHDRATTVRDHTEHTTKLWPRTGERLDAHSAIIANAKGEVARINHTAHELTHFRDMVVDMGCVLLEYAGTYVEIDQIRQNEHQPRLILIHNAP